MELQSWRPLTDLADIRERIARLSGGAGAWTPAADWFETDDGLVLVVDVPGVQTGSLEIALDGESIVVAGERDAVVPGEPRHRERPSGRFERSLRLPEPVEPESGEAQCVAGVLEVRLRKLHRTIDVQTSI